jgi:hypothetical protein
MTELSRSLLAAARDGLAPDPEVVARVRARVGVAVGATTATAAVSVVAKPVSAGSSGVLLKLGAIALVVSAVALGVTHHDASDDAPQVSISTAHDEPIQPAVTTTTMVQEPAAHIALATKPAHVEPASLSREVELIDQAMTALRGHDPVAALAAMRTFERETLGHAQMAEEAAAITIEAHCDLGEDVADRIAAFELAYPESAERSRITCNAVR